MGRTTAATNDFPPVSPENKLRPLAKAFEAVTGCRVCPATLYRWRKLGSHGISLPYVMVGGTSMISIAAAKEWIDQCSAAEKGEVAPKAPARDDARKRKAAAEHLILVTQPQRKRK